jgi:hypothetical protein
LIPTVRDGVTLKNYGHGESECVDNDEDYDDIDGCPGPFRFENAAVENKDGYLRKRKRYGIEKFVDPDELYTLLLSSDS